jgi:hypothetical protein
LRPRLEPPNRHVEKSYERHIISHEVSDPGPDCGRSATLYSSHPAQRKIAVQNLDRQGFETYSPLHKVFKKTPAGPVGSSEVMFPHMCFFQTADARLSISAARSTCGVSFVLSFTSTPPCSIVSFRRQQFEKPKTRLTQAPQSLPAQLKSSSARQEFER